jgi:hypothetical protein
MAGGAAIGEPTQRRGTRRVLTFDRADVLAQVRDAYPTLSYDDCTHTMLSTIARQHGVDFATAFFFDRVRRVPRNAAFAAAIEEGDPTAPPVRARGKVLIVPALFYHRRPARGGDGAVVRAVAERAGLDVEVAPVESGGSARRNAGILRDLLSRRSSEPTVIVSLSKGSADLRLAFEAMQNTPAGVRAWINVNGLLRGTPAIDRFMERWYRRLLLRLIILRAGGSTELPVEFSTSPTSPLHRAVVAPSGILVINLLGFPLAAHLGTTFGRVRHRQMASHGPNDGLGLLRDAIVEPGLTYPVWGADHYFRVPTVPVLLTRVIAYLIHTGCLVPVPENAETGLHAGRIR